MATITGFTSTKMQAIEDSTVVDGNIVGDNLILVTRDATQIDAGNVRGPQGIQGPIGEVSTSAMNIAIAAAIATAHGTGAITEAMLASTSVTNAKLGPDSVTGTKIANSAVASEHIASSSVTNAKLGPDSVTGTKIADNAVNSEHIVDNAIGNEHLQNDTVNWDEIDLTASGGTLESDTIRYFKILNIVFVQGSNVPQGASIATLPTSFRPGAGAVYLAPMVDAAGTPGRVTLNDNGVINTQMGTGSAVCFTAFFDATYTPSP